MTIDNVDNALRDAYLPAIANRLNNCDPFIARVEKTTRDVYGKEVFVNIEFREDKFHTLKADLATLSVDFLFYDKAVKVCKNSAAAFAELVNDEVTATIAFTEDRIRNVVYGDEIVPSFIGLKEFFSKEPNCSRWTPRTFGCNGYDFEYIKNLIDNENPDIDIMICSPSTKRKFIDANSNTNINIIEGPNKYKSVAFTDNILILTYKYMADNEIWFVNSRDFKFHQLCDWRWVEDENGKILKKDEDKGLWKATLIKYVNLMCHNPGEQIRIRIK